MSPRLLPAAALLAVVPLVVSCGDDAPVTTAAFSGDAARALEQQREEVRALAISMTEGARSAVAADVLSSQGVWEGCTSAFPETYRDFRYRAQVRLSASSASGDLLEPLRSVVDEAGLTASGDDPAKLRGSRDGVEASFWQLPEATAAAGQGDLLLTVTGPCVEVPEDDRDAWRDKREPDPELF